MKKYRIVRDDHSIYKVEVRGRFLFWTLWEQTGNVFSSIDEAKRWIALRDKPPVWEGTVKEAGMTSI